MAHIKKVLALLLAACVFCTIGIFAVTAAETDDAGEEVGASVGITVHYICEDGAPSIYYWNTDCWPAVWEPDKRLPQKALTSTGLAQARA